ncbi:MAG TPA: hypothetical protein VEF89_11225 [Solirubrobacteraceae bacterium]|nr:hypothetical protein [Solirubrobacteraceae bacterium]
MSGALIIQVPRDGPVDRQLSRERPPSLSGREVVVEPVPADAEGNINPPPAGEVVLSVPSPASLAREADEVRRVIDRAGRGVEPIVVVVEAAEEFLDEELAPVVEAAGRASRPVIVRVIRSA